VGGGLAILGALFARPAFRDIELERQIIIEEVREDLDERGRNVNLDDQSRRAVWGSHPLGFTICGPLQNIRRFRVPDVRQHFRRLYGARNMVLCVSGPIRSARVLAQARKAFARLAPGRRVEALAPPPMHARPRLKIVRNEAAQVQVHLLFRALPERDPDYLGLATLARVLDDGMSTRLHYRICDQKGLAYHVAASIEPLHDTAVFEVDAACAPGKLAALLREAFAILDEFRNESVSPAELDKAKRRFRRDLQASYDDLDGLAGWFGGTELFYRPQTHEERALRMDRIDAADIRAAARRVLTPERLSVTIVGSLRAALLREVREVVGGALRPT
jgi:predicted Zn-dependent peptidase